MDESGGSVFLESRGEKWYDRRLLGFGIDSPIIIMGLVAMGMVTILIGFFVYYALFLHNPLAARGTLVADASVGALLIGLAASLSFNSSVGKPREARFLARTLPWGGDEVALDVGCGRGHFSTEAAKMLSSGYVASIDHWSAWHITGNSPRSVLANAEAQGVGEAVIPVKSPSTELPFADSTFDVVASCLGLSHLGGVQDLELSLREMVRVLRVGGRLAVTATGYGRRMTKLLTELGMVEVNVARFRVGILPASERITARKPYYQVAAAVKAETDPF
ncbi:MAG TPA: class I SAM-dependent methyltransferase [Nitrososphaerales archaeon]|nr:class I SAM-dependent methyltransferase [Nitrososphaerales archaeon]